MNAESYIMKIKIKKIFFEVISNSKNFNVNFFQRNGQRPRFSQTYRGTRQRGDWTTSNMIYHYWTIELRKKIKKGFREIFKKDQRNKLGRSKFKCEKQVFIWNRN